MAASALSASEPLADHAVARRAQSPAIVEQEREAAIAEPDHGRFAPPDRLARDAPRDEPVPGYPPDDQDDQETVNGFAPPADLRPAAEPELEPAGEPSRLEAPRDAPSAPPTDKAEPSEDAAQPAEVSDLEKEMARLLDEISTTRRE
jgi:hypothetical protein